MPCSSFPGRAWTEYREPWRYGTGKAWSPSPVVLTTDEVKALFSGISGTSLLIAQVLYGSGLRLMELARLRVKDIDFGMQIITVRSGKGDNDRTTVLPE